MDISKKLNQKLDFEMGTILFTEYELAVVYIVQLTLG